jgi:hypothetical protein
MWDWIMVDALLQFDRASAEATRRGGSGALLSSP